MRLDQIKRSSLKSMMTGVEHLASPKPRLLKRSTVEYYRPDGARVIRLHRTDVLTMYFQPGHDAKHPGWAYSDIDCYSRIEIRTGGWLSMTTRDRINAFLPGFRIHGKINRDGWKGHCEGGPWYIMPWYRVSDHADYRLDSIELTEGLAIIDGRLPDSPKALAPAAIKSAIARFARYCAEIGFTAPPIHPGDSLVPPTKRQFVSQLLSGGHSWQRDGGYNSADIGRILSQCFKATSPHRLVAHKLGSDAMAAHLRKAVRDYLTKLLEGDVQP
jgi:hypothetical protein